MTNQASPDTSPPPEKMSARVLAVSEGLIEAGKTWNERQIRLAAVCSAWNLACEKPDAAAPALENWMADFAHTNPHVVAEQTAIFKQIMEIMIERKRRLYPDNMRRILEGEIVPGEGGKYRVDVKFARLP